MGAAAKTSISTSGAFLVHTELLLLKIDGAWRPDSIKTTGFPSVGIRNGESTFTSTLSASGIVVSTEEGYYFNPGRTTISAKTTLDLNTGEFSWCRTIVHPAPIEVEYQNRVAKLPVTFVPVTQTFIDSIELTQAIQQWQPLGTLKSDLAAKREPPVPIIAGKPAILRVYLQPLAQVTRGTIEVAGPVTETRSFTLLPHCTRDKQRRQADGCSSVDLYFLPPVSNFTFGVRLKNSFGILTETHDLPLRARITNTLKLHAVSVCNGDEFVAKPEGCAPAAALASRVHVLSKIAPTKSVVVDVTSHGPVRVDWLKHSDELNWWTEVLVELQGLERRRSGSASPAAGTTAKYYGMAQSPPAPLISTINGAAWLGLGVGASLMDSKSLGVDQSGESVAHEVGHMLNLRHTNTQDPRPISPIPIGCNLAKDPDTYWPATWDNRIRSHAGIEVGFDLIGSFSLAGGIVGKALDGNNTFDIMSYCVPRWISPLHYNGFITALGGGLPPPPTTEVATAAEPSWLVSGTIQDGVVHFRPLFAIDAVVEAGAGSHSIQVLDASGGPLVTTLFTPFTAETGASSNSGGFSLVVPRSPSAASLVLLSETKEVLGRLTLGGAVPAIQLQSPTAPETLIAERLLTWTITDPDSSTHTTRVEYSPDNGETWSDLGKFTTRQALVNFDELPGGATTLIRLMVSDGINSSTSTFGSFTTAKKSNVSAQILSPSADVVVAPRMIFLDGFGLDIDDGSLSGTALAWTSDGAGPLGTGERIGVTLPVGRHVITLTATDSDGNKATAKITVTVAGPAPVVTLAVQPLNTPATCMAATISVTTPGLPPVSADYSVNAGATWVPVPVSSLPFRFLSPGSGSITMLARVFDAAGQMTADSRQFTTTGPCAAVTPTTWAAPAGGGTQVIALTSPVQWTAFADQSWLTIAPASGTGTATVTLTAAASTSFAARTATAWIAGQPVTVTQAEGTSVFAVSPASWTAPLEGGARTITITSSLVDAPWTATTSAPWLTLSATAGVGSATVTLMAAPTASGPRNATATIAGQTVTVTQTTAVASDLRVTRVEGNLVTLRWSWNGPPTTGFVVAGGLQPGQRLATLPTGSDNPIVTFTAPTGSFFVRVYTADDTAFERPSNEVPLVVSMPIKPSPPANLLATVNGSRVDLAWTNTYGGGAPTGVRLQVSGAVNTSLTIALAESASFTGVPPGTYTVTAIATNAGGDSAPSNAVTLTFPTACTGSPLTPSQFLAYRLGRTLSVVWDTAQNGAAPTDFVITVPQLALNLATGGARSASGAVPPGTYTLSVSARNACGVSAASAAQTVVVP